MSTFIPGLTDLESVTLTANGSITSANVQCTATSCVWIVVPTDYQAVTVQLSGGFNATLQLELSWDGKVWSPAQAVTGETSASGNGTWNVNLNRAPSFRVRASSYSSGPVLVNIAARMPGFFGPEVPLTTWTGNQDAAGHDLNNVNAVRATRVYVASAPDGVYLDPVSINFQTNSLQRWQFAKAGPDDFYLQNYNDAGVVQRSILHIVRATGQVVWDIGTSSFTTSGQFNATGAINVQSDSGNNSLAQFFQGGVPRWTAGKNLSAESGGNLGSDYAINRFSDGGSFLGVAMSISRASGLTTFNNGLAVTSLPNANPGAGSKQMWYDPADSYRVKYAA